MRKLIKFFLKYVKMNDLTSSHKTYKKNTLLKKPEKPRSFFLPST